MFARFFFALRDAGIPVSPTSFLRLQQALCLGQVESIADLYAVTRALCIKSEKYFDLYDQVFAHVFEGAELPTLDAMQLDDVLKAMIEEWLKEPDELAKMLGLKREQVEAMSAEELIKYFLDRLKEQHGQHHGGSKWIGTRGTSPVGHSGFHPGGMRIGGMAGNFSAMKVALDRRYKDYSQDGPLSDEMLGEALKRLKHLLPAGPKDKLDLDDTIDATVRNAGEIELVFTHHLKDKLKVVIAVDNGGWSMYPYVALVQTLFDHARAQLKELRTFYFHNTIYDALWEDPTRMRRPHKMEELSRLDPETRFILVGDASMAPYELWEDYGSIYLDEVRTYVPSIERLKQISRTFKHCVWLNPKLQRYWSRTETIGDIAEVIPMFELTLDGLEAAVAQLMRK